VRAIVLAGFVCWSLAGAPFAVGSVSIAELVRAEQDEGTATDEGESPEADPAEVTRARIERLITLASTGRTVVRPQAAERLVEFGDDAVNILRERVGEDGEGLAAMGPELVEVLADFGDAELRKRLWWQLDEHDFPWRPQAARSLARSAQEVERPRFLLLVTDRLGQVRAAAVQTLGELGRDVAADDGIGLTEAALRDRLADTDDGVRRAAASALMHWGDTAAPFWLLEELKRDDSFFELRTGERARFAAAKALETQLGQIEGVAPALDPDQLEMRLAWRKLEERLLAANGGVKPELPDIALARVQDIDAIFGLELRSCRHGDLFLRWTADDELFVGTGRAARVALPEGTTSRLVAGVADRLERLEDERFWGVSGCDTEQLHWRPPGAERTANYLVSKGAEPIPDLRPEALTDVARAILANLPDGAHDDPRRANLRRRTADALAAIGGPTGSRQ
jgi:HEAT repeat protein